MSESLEELARSYEERMREYIEKRFIELVDIAEPRHLFELKTHIAESLGEEPKSVRISTYWKQELRETDFELSVTFEKDDKLITCFVTMPVKSMATSFTVSPTYREHYAQDIMMELDKNRAIVRCTARK